MTELMTLRKRPFVNYVEEDRFPFAIKGEVFEAIGLARKNGSLINCRGDIDKIITFWMKIILHYFQNFGLRISKYLKLNFQI